MENQLNDYKRRHAQALGLSPEDEEARRKQVEEDEKFARQLAQELELQDADEERARVERQRRQQMEDEEFARALSQEGPPEGALPERSPNAFDGRAFSTHGDHTSPRDDGSPRTRGDNVPAASSSSVDLDEQLARQLQSEEEGDVDPLRSMPGAFPSSSSAADTSPGSSAPPLFNPMSAVLSHLLNLGHQTQERDHDHDQVPRPPTARTYTFGYDSNRGFFRDAHEVPIIPDELGKLASFAGQQLPVFQRGHNVMPPVGHTPDPLLGLLRAIATSRGARPFTGDLDESAIRQDPNSFAEWRSGFRPILFSQFGADLGGALFNEVPNSYEDLVALAERLGPAQSRGATDEQIARIPVMKFRTGKGTGVEVKSGQDAQGEEAKNCPICLGDFEDGDDVMVMLCTHQ
ncbi:hypothetical protein HK104_008334 [Borealophlyctis nickersoniae]|nr:hypothetical protein HK104_008334 [Borealophlyctis nickersoniae]